MEKWIRCIMSVWLLVICGCGDTSEEHLPPDVVQLPSDAQEDARAEDSASGLEERLAELEYRISLLEQGRTRADVLEEESREVYEAMRTAHRSGDYPEAMAQMAILSERYAETEYYRRSRRIESELALFDQPVPLGSEAHVSEWFTDSRPDGVAENLGLNQGASLVVFWERWCPACRTEMPRVQQIHDDWSTEGLGVLALTRGSRNETPESIEAFVSEGGFSLPIALEDGEIASAFAVQALPAAAFVRDGVIVWRGSLNRITDTDLREWMAGPIRRFDPEE